MDEDRGQILEIFLMFALLAAALTMVLRTYWDYVAFVALGPGGTPSTLAGYLKVKLLSYVALKDPYEPSAQSMEGAQRTGYLAELPERTGYRPMIRGIAPHRQTTQKASTLMLKMLQSEMAAIAESGGSQIIDTSCIEKHGAALFHQTATRHNEICHLHATDGSMHMVLNPADSKLVLEARWGERHPLSRGGWFERFVPASFVLVYAPRDEEEIKTISQIIRAAAWYVEGEKGLREQSGLRRDSGYCSADDLRH